MTRAARTPAGASRDAVSPVAMREVTIPPLDLAGTLRLPADATCLVVFAHGSGSSRFSPRNNAVAEGFAARGIATLLFDLLTPAEEGDRANVFDIPLLAERLADAVAWVRRGPGLSGLSLGLFGASTGAAAALERRGKLWTSVEGIGALAGLDLGELGDQRVALGFGKSCDSSPLRLDPQT
jgi:putative phosphoribosyl transferase